MLTNKSYWGLRSLYLIIGILFLISWPTSEVSANSDFTDLSLEQLMQIEVTSAAKKTQPLAQAATAIYVISNEDIRRSGVTSIPEALRMAPGVQVAHIDQNKWAISIRGFNQLFSDKLLVLIDGRTIYNALFSGIFWDIQDTLLEDIERIEVIRGPGAALWGANAVNGVINIITKNTEETRGVLASITAGSEEKLTSSLRFGGNLGTKGNYRIYGKYLDRDTFVDRTGADAWDDHDLLRCGFRVDLQANANQALTIQGDIYDGTSDGQVTYPTLQPFYSQTEEGDMNVDGGNLLTRYEHHFDNNSELSLQAYYNLNNRDMFIGDIKMETIDIDLQHRFNWGDNQEITWGLGYRYIEHDVSLYQPDLVVLGNHKLDLFSAFFQDEITLIPERLKLIIGSRFEDNYFSGFEFQPSARILWTPTKRISFWTAISRAVRTPSTSNINAMFTIAALPPEPPIPLPVKVMYIGNKNFKSENLLAFETGGRIQLNDNLSIDVALFYNLYDDLISSENMSLTITLPYITATTYPENNSKATTFGGELVIDWLPLSWWHLQFVGSLIDIDSDPDNYRDKETPEYQFSLRSMIDLPHNFEFDAWLRRVDEIQQLEISDYTQLDLRIGWRPHDNLELSLVGQNLLQSQQLEQLDETINFNHTEVERSFYLKATLEF